jgi:hypothetical protein
MAKTTEFLRLRIFTIGIQELSHLATSCGKQISKRQMTLSCHFNKAQITRFISEIQGIVLMTIPFVSARTATAQQTCWLALG